MRVNLFKISLTAVLLFFCTLSHASLEVGLTEFLPFIDINHNGKTIRIERIQNTDHRLTNSYTKTSRACPPFCIHPMKAAPGVVTVGEIELIDFLKTDVKNGEGMLVDSRMPDWFKKGTIPGSVNLPFSILENETEHTHAILGILGAESNNDSWNFSNAKKLMLYCNGPWCDQSPRAIKNLLRFGYPPEKLLYYRAGMQGWQSMGLTIIKP